MEILEWLQRFLNLGAAIAIIYVAISVLRGKKLPDVTAVNFHFRRVLNTKTREEFARMFDASPEVSEEDDRSSVQEQVDRHLTFEATMTAWYRIRLEKFVPDASFGFSRTELEFQLETLKNGETLHKANFWTAHDLARRCGYKTGATLQECVAMDEERTPDYPKIVTLESRR